MDKEIRQSLEKVKECFLNKMDFLVKSPQFNFSSNIKSWESIHFLTLPESEKRMSYSLELVFSNKKTGRSIMFRYNDGINADKLPVNSISLQISTTNTNDVKPHQFNIEDYCRAKGIEFSVPGYFIQEGIDLSVQKACLIIEEYRKVFYSYGLIALVDSDQWIKVPIDKSPYK